MFHKNRQTFVINNLFSNLLFAMNLILFVSRLIFLWVENVVIKSLSVSGSLAEKKGAYFFKGAQEW